MGDAMDDMELVQEYVTQRSERAFETLVQRHVHLVYSSAMRQVGNPQLADEITQATFVILAHKAHTLRPGTVLPGWLIKTVRYVAASERRSAARRQRHEREAQMETIVQNPAADPRWQEMAPLLDEALAALGNRERDAVVLRYLQRKPLQEVAMALGVDPGTAQKRTWRAVEKLRAFFGKRGVIAPAIVVTTALAANAVQAAPPGIAAASASAALHGTAAASTTALINATFKLMAWAKLKLAATVAAGVLITTGTALVVVAETRTPEPRYQGRTATDWFKDYRQAWLTVAMPATNVGANAFLSLQKIGPEAIPYIVRQMERSDVARQKARAAGKIAIPAPIGDLNQIQREQNAFDTVLTGFGGASLPQLISLLKNPHGAVRFAAAYAMHYFAESDIHTTEEVTALAASLTDESPEVRAMVADCLSHMGIDAAPAVPALIQILGEDDGSNGDLPGHGKRSTASREQYLLALGGAGPTAKAAVPMIKKIMTGPNVDYGLEVNSAIALWKIEHNVADAQPVLMNYFINRGGYRSPTVVEALGEMGPAARDAIPILSNIVARNVKFAEPSQRPATRQAQTPTPHAVQPNGPPPLSSFEQARLQCAIALWRIDGRIDDTLPVILDAFVNHDGAHNHLVIRALGEIGPPANAAVPKLLGELTYHRGVLERFPEMEETLKRIDPMAAKTFADSRSNPK